MKLLVSYIFFAAQAFASILSTDSATRGIIEAVGLQWNGTIDTNGTTTTLTGTAESIYKRIIALNPNYEQERDIIRSRFLPSEGLARRDAMNFGHPHCNVYTDIADVIIVDGIKYLYKIGDGICGVPPGRPGSPSCSSVSCSYNSSGIYVCNDQNFEAQVPCRLVAE
ncbi:hypothetical protein QBC47DRAFT_429290 [Echria macrotheca]|uniref:Uncharacterized protein n=1 Tax=Echria macrotheca TaxID=438768 RepID=A0AAJ0B9C9_9PEZI|nr:hypothetical protein QBC47DRAFT_429290 [Echria macrotheca]